MMVQYVGHRRREMTGEKRRRRRRNEKSQAPQCLYATTRMSDYVISTISAPGPKPAVISFFFFLRISATFLRPLVSTFSIPRMKRLRIATWKPFGLMSYFIIPKFLTCHRFFVLTAVTNPPLIGNFHALPVGGESQTLLLFSSKDGYI